MTDFKASTPKQENKIIRIGTRPSPLALKQVEIFLSFLPSNLKYEIVKIHCHGDNNQNYIMDLDFYKQIEKEILSDNIDIGVHSAKDLSCSLPPQLCIGAYLPRENPKDVLVLGSEMQKEPKVSLQLPWKIGTSSERRKSFIQILFPCLCPSSIRGNIHTRLEKLRQGQYDAIILSYAALKRLNLLEKVSFVDFPETGWSPGQGAIALECRKEDLQIQELLKSLNHKPTDLIVSSEKAVLKTLNGGCNAPLSVISSLEEQTGNLFMQASFAVKEKNMIIRHEIHAVDADDSIGVALGNQLIELLQEIQ